MATLVTTILAISTGSFGPGRILATANSAVPSAHRSPQTRAGRHLRPSAVSAAVTPASVIS